MKIECAGSRMLVLELTDDDMKELKITYNDMCVCDNALKEVVGKVLGDSRLALHKGSECAMYAFPDCRGGCMMFLLFGEEQEKLVYETDDVSALLDCLKAIGENAAVYTLDGAYRIVISPNQSLAFTAGEFMYPCGGDGQAGYTDEHWTLLRPVRPPQPSF